MSFANSETRARTLLRSYSSARTGAPVASASASVQSAPGAHAASQSRASFGAGMATLTRWQRLTIVGVRRDRESVTSRITLLPGGSSRVLSRLLAAWRFIACAGFNSTAL